MMTINLLREVQAEDENMASWYLVYYVLIGAAILLDFHGRLAFLRRWIPWW